MHPRVSPSSDDSLQPYAGRWVARVDGRVVAQGGTPQQAAAAAQRSHYKERLRITYIPLEMNLSFHPLLERIRAVIPSDTLVYLVGGAVRDALRNRPSHDLDFSVQGDAKTLARQVGDALDAAYYPLHGEFDAGRVVLDVDGERYILDFVGLHPGGLEADLKTRDFTINAIAVDVRAPQQLLDPLGGAVSLKQGELRACSPASLQDDPVRILRAVRLAVDMQLRILPETRRLMKAALPGLEHVSPERIRAEFLRIFGGRQPATALRILDLMGVLAMIFPETTALKGITQSSPHVYPVWEHTLAVIERLDGLLNALGLDYDPDTSANNLVFGHVSLRLGRYREKIAQHLSAETTPDITRRALLFFSALYHDIAKPLTRTEEENGRIRFFQHEKQGAILVAGRAAALHMSADELTILEKTVAHHMRPLWLSQNDQAPGPRAIYRFFRDTGDIGVDICLLSLADFLGTYGPGVPQQAWAHHVDVIRLLLEGWWERREETVFPPPLLNGRDVMQLLDIPPGPRVGELLEMLREAQAAGEITTREQAEAFLRTTHDETASSHS